MFKLIATIGRWYKTTECFEFQLCSVYCHKFLYYFFHFASSLLLPLLRFFVYYLVQIFEREKEENLFSTFSTTNTQKWTAVTSLYELRNTYSVKKFIVTEILRCRRFFVWKNLCEFCVFFSTWQNTFLNFRQPTDRTNMPKRGEKQKENNKHKTQFTLKSDNYFMLCYVVEVGKKKNSFNHFGIQCEKKETSRFYVQWT